jgi:hypothetical protein
MNRVRYHKQRPRCGLKAPIVSRLTAFELGAPALDEMRCEDEIFSLLSCRIVSVPNRRHCLKQSSDATRTRFRRPRHPRWYYSNSLDLLWRQIVQLLLKYVSLFLYSPIVLCSSTGSVFVQDYDSCSSARLPCNSSTQACAKR